MLRITSALLLFLFSILSSAEVCAQQKNSFQTVVIDAGHGGKDPGTIGARTQEKYVNLGIALKLGEMIRKTYPDVRVIFTRQRDEFIELHQRADIANKNDADLFISIHCNANNKHSLHGAETYVMGLHRSQANLDIAKKENASILMESNYSTTYNGFDPNSDESYITFTMFQNANLDQSTEFAAEVQDELKDRVGLNDRGVRQAGFLVLYKTTMPSVLVEAGFLSNPEEEKFLISDKGQEFISSAIFRAFRDFKEKNHAEVGKVVANNQKSDSQKSDSQRPDSQKSEVRRGDGQKGEVRATEGKKADGQKSVTKSPAGSAADKKKQGPSQDQVSFRIQVALSKSDMKLSNPKFKGLSDVKMYRHQGLYKYTSGNEASLDDALTLLDVIKKKGFSDAFVVAFRGSERITIAEARSILDGKNQVKSQ